MGLLDRLFRTLIRAGPLTVISGGRTRSYGAPADGLKPVTIRLSGRGTEGRIVRNPALGFGEAYMDGRLAIEDGDVRDLLELIAWNLAWEDEGAAHALRWRPRRLEALWDTWNWKRRSRRNVAHHYDLSTDFFRLFLDDDLQYSCAYFAEPDMGLDAAQAAKKAHIAAKLRLAPGQRVLDIGCGWGGMALFLARNAGVTVHGITLSEEQLRVAQERAKSEGLADRVTFALADYRDVEGEYDRIVSVGMFEHVGPPHYAAFLRKCRALLAPDGLMLLHTIARADGPTATDPFLAKYIFPGGYIPALSQIAPAVEQARLWLTDLEVLRLHYARTLACWYERTVAAGEEVERLYSPSFLRMWLFYLAGGIAAFRHDALAVYQLQLARRRDAAPITRDYLADAESAFRNELGGV
ncbi:MAG TPA: cyclopropane-fatty-acyl-phospholipid synthase family protein [Allosphingosinicella sp.]|jgi:cyclopropane-fatty-acyl-phospholipid synthase|nr:cyclopropane-fatty-acyl-phospholipid synthase family protein [Allosphingosinicella sp.]